MASAPSWPGHAARGLFVLGAREEDVQKLGPSWICAATHTDSLKTRGLPRRSFPCLHPQPLASCSAKPHRGVFNPMYGFGFGLHRHRYSDWLYYTLRDYKRGCREGYKAVIGLLGAGSVLGFPF